MEKPFLTATDLAKLLKVSPQAIYYWAKKGKIPHYRTEKCVRFDPGDIEHWLKTNYKRQKAS